MLRRALALLVLASVSAYGAGEAQDRASAEGVVILRLLSEHSSIIEALIIDLPTPEVALIRQSLPKLAPMLLSTDETRPPRIMPNRSWQISVKSVQVTPSDATIEAGVSGSTQRFVLKKRGDKWEIIQRI